MTDPKDKKSDSPPNRFIRYTSIPIQMAAIIYLGKWLGDIVDMKYGNGEGTYGTIITLLAVFLAIFQVIREVIGISKEQDDK